MTRRGTLAERRLLGHSSPGMGGAWAAMTYEAIDCRSTCVDPGRNDDRKS
jgi:hypothetical protein